MERHTVHGKPVSIDHIQGIVSDLNKTTKTHISGGGGMTIRGTGKTAPLSTSHTDHTEFWVKANDEKERHFNTSSKIIPLKNGHEVFICYYDVAGKEEILMAYNINTGEQYIEHKVNPLKTGIFFSFVFAFVVAMFAAIPGKAEPIYISFFAALILGIFLSIRDSKSFKQLSAIKEAYMATLNQ